MEGPRHLRRFRPGPASSESREANLVPPRGEDSAPPLFLSVLTFANRDAAAMLTQAIWWTTNALEAIILGRAVQHQFVRAYPIFYAYLAYVLIESMSRFYVYIWHPASYADFYWATQSLSVFLGYGVVWEICRQALARYPGAFRMAQSTLALILVGVVSKVLANVLRGDDWTLAQSIAEQERDFRIVQAFLLLAIVALISYYRIRIGRNLRGLILGYGFFIGASIMNLTFRAFFGDAVQWLWQYLPASAYLVALLIWCGTLWSYEPNPEPEMESRIEQDYQSLVQATRQRFRQVRAHVGRTARPS